MPNANFLPKILVRSMPSPMLRGVEILITTESINQFGPVDVGQVTMERVEEGAQIEPSFRLTQQNAQVLMDDLWSCGIRPTEGAGSAGAMRAAEGHIADLRQAYTDLVSIVQRLLPK